MVPLMHENATELRTKPNLPHIHIEMLGEPGADCLELERKREKACELAFAGK